jgi:tRNA C32,U32 (ribose-2'-O)-methylase TrmJ
VKSGVCGGQHVLHRSRCYETLDDALEGIEVAVAVTRWTTDSPHAHKLATTDQLVRFLEADPRQLMIPRPLTADGKTSFGAAAAAAAAAATAAAAVSSSNSRHADVVRAEDDAAGMSSSSSAVPQRPEWAAQGFHLGDPSARTGRVALVFGREDVGFLEEELRRCCAVASIPMGRLQESMSLSHAVAVLLASLFQARVAAVSS